MSADERIYLAIDLKSFYASVECVERGLDPMDTNLVVADESRTDKTIVLAVSPALKAYGIPGRPRLFEVVRRVREVNRARRHACPRGEFTGASYSAAALADDPTLAVDYIVAPPRMAFYMQYSTRIYEIYLRYAAAEDIHVYSIDEVFVDATQYLSLTGLSARAFLKRILKDVLAETGITATAGIGSNLYLCKVAMDIVAKHMPADEDGVRIAELNEQSYREQLWEHRPITDFWRVGKGYAEKLGTYGMYTMGDVARCSLGGEGDVLSEALLYRLFGVNAELLIDHAWGWEPCTIADIKAYKPESSSISSGQVLPEPYAFEKGRIVLSEMAESLALDLFQKRLVTDQIVLTVGYDAANAGYRGETALDRYGRRIPRHAHGSRNIPPTSGASRIREAALALYDFICDRALTVRRFTLAAEHVVPQAEQKRAPVQLSLFPEDGAQAEAEEREMRRQEAVVQIKKKYGKNAILKGNSLEEGATAKGRNEQIGGHKA